MPASSHEHRMDRAVLCDAAADLQCQPRLAHTAGTDQRDQARARLTEPLAPRFRRRRRGRRESVKGKGSEAPLNSSTAGPSGGVRAHLQQRIARRPGKIECRRQRPQRLDVRATALSALEGTDGVNGEARNRCELLLSKPRCLAERLQMRPKRPRSADLHCGYLTALLCAGYFKPSFLPSESSAIGSRTTIATFVSRLATSGGAAAV